MHEAPQYIIRAARTCQSLRGPINLLRAFIQATKAWAVPRKASVESQINMKLLVCVLIGGRKVLKIMIYRKG
jgi:hypothetical protein